MLLRHVFLSNYTQSLKIDINQRSAKIDIVSALPGQLLATLCPPSTSGATWQGKVSVELFVHHSFILIKDGC